MMMRATLDSLGATDRTLWVADSFTGFPLPDREQYPEDRLLDDLSTFDFLSAPLEDVRQNFERFGLEEGIEFVPGFFDETLPGLFGKTWSVIRLDGDTYEATSLALESLYGGLTPGGFLIIDDYWLIDECRQAVADFRSAHQIEEPIESIDPVAARWRCERRVEISEAPPARRRTSGERTAARLPRSRVPGVREIELQYENDGRRHRLRAAKAEIDALRAGAEAGAVPAANLRSPQEE